TVLSSLDGDAWTTIVGDLKQGRSARFIVKGEQTGLFLRGGDGAASKSAASISIEKLPRIGVYAPWSGVMDEGWLRWTLDHFQIPFSSVRNETLRAGKLHDVIDVLVIPNISRKQLDEGREAGAGPSEILGGLAPEGALAIDEFVREG